MITYIFDHFRPIFIVLWRSGLRVGVAICAERIAWQVCNTRSSGFPHVSTSAGCPIAAEIATHHPSPCEFFQTRELRLQDWTRISRTTPPGTRIVASRRGCLRPRGCPDWQGALPARTSKGRRVRPRGVPAREIRRRGSLRRGGRAVMARAPASCSESGATLRRGSGKRGAPGHTDDARGRVSAGRDGF